MQTGRATEVVHQQEIGQRELLGNFLYLVVAHQILHVCVWASNAVALIPMLSYIFPGSIDGTDHWFKEVYKFEYYPMILHNIPLLLLLFAHHSIFARPWMQNKIIGFSSRAVERTLYVVTSALLTQYVMHTWKPMPHDVWSVKGPVALVMEGLCLLGFIWTAITCLTFSHNDLFGFKEALTGITPHWVPHYMPFVYKYSRSPLWLGVITTMWAASEMSVGRMIFATAWTVYSWIGGQMQEKDMVRKYGKEYEDYQRRVAFMIPYFKF